MSRPKALAAVCAAFMLLLTLVVAPPAAAATAAAACTPVSSTQTLEITKRGVYDGCGKTVRGIENTASDVTIQNFISKGASNYGIWSYGKNVTIKNNTVTKVLYKGNDLDGIRFFGDETKLLNNRVYNVEGNDSRDAHVDFIQTFTMTRPGSSNVVIQGNRCENIRHQCVMAEGPRSTDGGGGGGGISRDWLIADNQFECYGN